MIRNLTGDWLHEDNISIANYTENFGSDDDPGFVLRHGLMTTTVLCLAYSAVFVLGLLGNGFVVAVVVRSPRMRSPTNLFIVNLACADLLINVLCLPFTLIANLIPAWILGSVICKAVAYFQGVSVSASVNTLMAISLERCKAITSPLSGSMTFHSCRIIIAIIWVFALSINLPWIVVFTLEPIGIIGSKAQICTELWPTRESENLYFVLANLLVCYLLPLFVISACYIQIWRRVAFRRMPGAIGGQLIIHKSKVKVVKMLFIVIITFAFSWLPLYVLFCIIKFGQHSNWSNPDNIIVTLIPITQWLGASNSCINPIIYTFFNRKFREGFKAILTSKSCCSPLQQEKYNSYKYTFGENRYKSYNLTVVKKDNFVHKHNYNSQNVNVNKKGMLRSQSATVDCKNSNCMGERSKSANLLQGTSEIPLNVIKTQKNEHKCNEGSKV